MTQQPETKESPLGPQLNETALVGNSLRINTQIGAFLRKGRSHPRLLLSILALLCLLASWLMLSLTEDSPSESGTLAMPLLLTLAAANLSGGYFPVAEMLQGLRRRKFDVEFLMLLAAAAAILLQDFLESGLLLFLFSFSGALNDLAGKHMRQAVSQLKEYEPQQAAVLRDGQEFLTDVREIQPGDVISVWPGMRLALDGEIQKGTAYLDESMITGEGRPVKKGPGDAVYAGSLNGLETLQIQVTQTANSSQLQKIIQLIEKAQESSAPLQRRIDKITRIYVPGILVLTVLTFVIGLWQNGTVSLAAWPEALQRALIILVAASPCALVISTPTSVLCAIGAAARQKVLIKGGEYVELLSRVTAVIFDKTGTLTLGRPQVTRIIPCNGFTERELLATAGIAEQQSQHPFAQALMSMIRERGIALELPTTSQILEGKGVEATYSQNGQPAQSAVGNLRLLETFDLGASPELLGEVYKLESTGISVSLVMRRLITLEEEDQLSPWELMGMVGVADPVRPESRKAISALQQYGIRGVHMLTGDNQTVARQVATEVGIQNVHAGLLPEQKVNFLQELAKQKQPVAMVGDGFNDAPSLATAPVGIAMGIAGVGVTLETADVVLLTDNLNRLPFLFRLARAADRILAQNLFLSVASMVLLVTWAYVGWLEMVPFALPLPMAVIGHEGSTLLVVFNGLRLLAVSPQAQYSS